MISPADRQPIIVADAGPLIRLAAAGLLDTLRGLNRRIVLVDRVIDEVCGDRTTPFAIEVSDWLARMGDSIWPAVTAIGAGIEALRDRQRNPEEEAALKSALRNSGELAVREFIDGWLPSHPGAALVVYEDRKVASLFIEVDYPLTLMTTRAFAQTIAAWGVNVDAVAVLETVADRYDLKPALVAEIDPDIPADLRMMPQPSGSKERP